MESAQPNGRFWPLSPRLWRRSNEYSKVVFEPRRPPTSPIEIRKHDRIDETPDLLRSRSFIKDNLDHLNLEDGIELRRSLDDKCRWSVDSKKPPVKETKKDDVVKLRAKKRQREPRPNSLQLLLCPSNSGHYSSNTWRYTRVRSKRFGYFIIYIELIFNILHRFNMKIFIKKRDNFGKTVLIKPFYFWFVF